MVNDFVKRFVIAFVFMVLLVLLMFGAKAIHADQATGWIWPVKGVITSGFGARGGEHKGIDIAAPMGTPVVATKAGVVKRSYDSSSYGNVVFLLHKNGDETVYAHMKERLVHKGEVVKQGQEIGEVGSTGDSTGPHLHFEVHHGLWNIKKTNAFNPLLVLGSQHRDKSLPANAENASKRAQPTSKKVKQTAEGHISHKVQKEDADQGQPMNAESEAHARRHFELLEYSPESYSKKVAQKIVKVKRGDTLWGLAHQYKVPIRAIKKWNHLKGHLLQIGQTLKLYPHMFKTYQVHRGDTLSKIAQSAGLSVHSLVHLNHLQGKTVYPDEILITSLNQQ